MSAERGGPARIVGPYPPDSPNHPHRAGKFEQGEMEIYEAFEALGDYVDSADPDVEFPNVRLA